MTYQGSHRSGVKVTVYPQNGDGTYGKAIAMTGTTARSGVPCIIGCSVQSALGQGSSFSVTFKRAGFADPFKAFPLDSWVDVSFTDSGLSWHVLRGLIDEVRASHGVQNGAPTKTYTITGRSFQKVWEDMDANFNQLVGDREVSTEVIDAVNSFKGSPDTVCRALLINILRSLGRRGRGLWAMPATMPGASAGGTVTQVAGIGPQILFVDAVQLVTRGFDLYGISRSILSKNLLQGGGALWSLAQSFSDPTLCELISDIYPRGRSRGTIGTIDTDGSVGLPESQSQMVAWLRDKPFMAVDPLIDIGPTGMQSPYFNLPQFIVPLQNAVSINVGMQGYERVNAFYLGNPDGGSAAANFLLSIVPLWDVRDQVAHGLRTMVIPQTYSLLGAGDLGKYGRTIDSTIQVIRRLVRDFYCGNSMMLSGDVALASGAPWVKVGCRLQVRDQRDIELPLNGYIEGVSHNYSPMGGTRTSVTFTRGFYGEEGDMLNTLRGLSARYTQVISRVGLSS